MSMIGWHAPHERCLRAAMHAANNNQNDVILRHAAGKITCYFTSDHGCCSTAVLMGKQVCGSVLVNGVYLDVTHGVKAIHLIQQLKHGSLDLSLAA